MMRNIDEIFHEANQAVDDFNGELKNEMRIALMEAEKSENIPEYMKISELLENYDSELFPINVILDIRPYTPYKRFVNGHMPKDWCSEWNSRIEYLLNSLHDAYHDYGKNHEDKLPQEFVNEYNEIINKVISIDFFTRCNVD